MKKGPEALMQMVSARVMIACPVHVAQVIADAAAVL
jgi:hypothetical protein